MERRVRWAVAIGSLVLVLLIAGAAIAQAVRQHSLDPIWTVGWLPAVVVAVYPSVLGRDRAARRPCLPRLRRSAGS
jgi:hypothetical protein